MSRVYEPFICPDGEELSVIISASHPHPRVEDGRKTEYKISIGLEKWSDEPVLKIQMLYDGKIAGRKCPSYPVNRRDLERINSAMQEVMRRYDEISD